MLDAYNFLVNDLKIKYGDFLVVAVSGGPDSMSLLDILLKIRKKYRNRNYLCTR